jgi:C1A family cysteine protease
VKLIPESRTHSGYGWIPDLPDHRDLKLGVDHPRMMAMPGPVKIDLRPKMPAVYNQGHVGSCTGNAIAAVAELVEIGEGEAALVPSRLFIYYSEREIEGTTTMDCGASIRDGFKAISTLGFCFEDVWPYDESMVTTRPSQAAYDAAKMDVASKYLSVDQDRGAIQGALSQGHPVVLGFSVFESFNKVGADGVVAMPNPAESLEGGHAVVIVGCDDDTQRYIVRNSWGPGWGDAGYFHMPYAYVENPNLANDFWILVEV